MQNCPRVTRVVTVTLWRDDTKAWLKEVVPFTLECYPGEEVEWVFCSDEVLPKIKIHNFRPKGGGNASPCHPSNHDHPGGGHTVQPKSSIQPCPAQRYVYDIEIDGTPHDPEIEVKVRL